jgi:hypothetical protein
MFERRDSNPADRRNGTNRGLLTSGGDGYYYGANGQRYIVTGGGQDFVRMYSDATYGIPIEQVVGTAGATKYGYDKEGKPTLTKEPKLTLNDNNAGKPEGIHLMIGRRPGAAFGNSTGDQQMLVAAFEPQAAKIIQRKVLHLQIGAHRAIEDDDAFF